MSEAQRIKTLENDLEHALASVGAFRAAIEDIFSKAAGESAEDGFIRAYVLPVGTLHRAIGLARGTDAGGHLLAQLVTERARAERAEAGRDRAVKARLDWQRDYERDRAMWWAQRDDARARAEAAEGREARLRFLLTKTVLTVVVDSGGVNAWHCQVCFGTARSGQSPLHLRGCEYVAALADTPEDLPATTPRESHPATIRVTEVRRGVPTIHSDEIDPLTARISALEGALDSTARELEAWHSERPCPPEMRDSCVSCGVIEQARAALAGESAPAEPEVWCSEDRHIVLPSGEACVCGENRSELLL